MIITEQASGMPPAVNSLKNSNPSPVSRFFRKIPATEKPRPPSKIGIRYGSTGLKSKGGEVAWLFTSRVPWAYVLSSVSVSPATPLASAFIE